MRVDDISQLSPAAQRQIAEKLMLQHHTEQKRKYGNTPTQIGPVKFDSKAEAERFLTLQALVKAGTISDLRLQPEYTLQEAFTRPGGERVRAIRYRADFSYTRDGETIIEDVKSDATKRDKTYRMKNKMMAERGYKVVEV